MVHKLFVGNRPATKKEVFDRRWRRRAWIGKMSRADYALFLFTHDA